VAEANIEEIIDYIALTKCEAGAKESSGVIKNAIGPSLDCQEFQQEPTEDFFGPRTEILSEYIKNLFKRA